MVTWITLYALCAWVALWILYKGLPDGARELALRNRSAAVSTALSCFSIAALWPLLVVVTFYLKWMTANDESNDYLEGTAELMSMSADEVAALDMPAIGELSDLPYPFGVQTVPCANCREPHQLSLESAILESRSRGHEGLSKTFPLCDECFELISVEFTPMECPCDSCMHLRDTSAD